MEILRITDIEETALALKRLYAQHGYRKFKMSRFEELEFYIDNRSFLEDDRITAFSDPSGKLLALRPDVTLSIVKNAREKSEKVYYGEYVYRTPRGSGTIDEILQVGLEHIGELDAYGVGEVIWLALESLHTLSEDYILDVSHMGLLVSLLGGLGLDEKVQAEVMRCVGEKNAHDAVRILTSHGVEESRAREFAELASMSGSFKEMLPRLRAADVPQVSEIADELEQIYRTIEQTGNGSKVRIDLSVVNDMIYYNGVVFSGYVNGVPFRVLSGGRYDRLLERLGKKSGAIGFAVYLGKLERYVPQRVGESGAALVYEDGASPERIMSEMQRLSADGTPVVVVREGGELPQEAKRVYRMGKDGALTNA